MESLRVTYNRRRNALDEDRRSWFSHWQEITDFLLPRRGRYVLGDTDRGGKKNGKIINSTGTLALRTLRSGMMAGLTSPSRPWFRLGTPDPELAEFGSVKVWLELVAQRMQTVFQRSNLYQILAVIYEELGAFGTGALAVVEDYQDVIRARAFTAGEYWLGMDQSQRLHSFYRTFHMTTLQMVNMFGIDKVSESVRAEFQRGVYDTKHEVAHVVEPNDMRRLEVPGVRGMPWRTVYYEPKGSSREGDGLLRVSGFEEQAVFAPRWDASEDAYGRSPGMDALGDVKQLQTEEKRKAQMIDKISTPPLQAPGASRNSPVSQLPGGLTYVSNMANNQKVQPIHEIQPVAVQIISEDIRAIEERINRVFYADLFLMLTMSDRREITAREVAERHEEKLLMLGPVVERVQHELLDPIIDRVFAIMLRGGLIPEPPRELVDAGGELRVEYISLLAQAQKLVGIGGVERLFGFGASLAATFPSVVDKLDADQAIDELAAMIGTPQGVVRTDDAVAEIRQAREQQQQAESQAAAMPDVANALEKMSRTEVNTDTLLGRMTGAA